MKKFLSLVVFGIVFGFLEAAVVTYLRKLFGDGTGFASGPYRMLLNLGVISFISPATALIPNPFLVMVERGREAATIIMLVCLSYLAGRNLRQRVGAFLVAYSLWDIFYYVFLKLLLDWPKTLFDIDIYFMLPYVWVGPVITAVVASIIFFIVGTYLYTKKG